MRAGAFVVGAMWLLGLLSVCCFLGVGCSRTEMVVGIAATELAIPDELDRIAITVTNPRLDPEGKSPIFVSPQTALCATGQTPSATCATLPTTLTLYPGDARPNETVRVQLDALLQGRVVLSQASIFSFANGKSGRLTFDLYRDCLQLECAAVDQACAQGGVCKNLAPVVDAQSQDMAPSPVTLISATSAPVMDNAPSFDVIVPSDAVANDHLLVAFTAVFGGHATVSPPPGWRQVTWLDAEGTGAPAVFLFERFVAANEPATHSFTINAQGAFLNATFHVLDHRGVRLIEGLRTLPGNGAPTLPSVNVTGGGRVLVGLVSRLSAISSECQTPAGFTRILNGAIMGFSVRVGVGMTGDRMVTCSPEGNYGAIAFALAP